jgi:hypothetical protein
VTGRSKAGGLQSEPGGTEAAVASWPLCPAPGPKSADQVEGLWRRPSQDVPAAMNSHSGGDPDARLSGR